MENLVRRLTALYAEETLGEDVIVRELPETSVPTGIADDEEEGGIGTAVSYHLETYFNAHSRGSLPSRLYERILHEVERPLISLTLQATNGNQIKAAAILGINRNTLRKKIRILDIPVTRKNRRGLIPRWYNRPSRDIIFSLQR